MPTAVPLRTDFSTRELRWVAKKTRGNSQSSRLLSLAVVLDGVSRDDAARIGGMSRQTLRDWVHRFNVGGPDALPDAWKRLIAKPETITSMGMRQWAHIGHTQ